MADLEELDYGYDLDEEEKDASHLTDTPVQEQDENLDEYQDEEVVSDQPQRAASSVHSRLSGLPQIPAEQEDYEQDGIEDDPEISEDYQEDVVSQEEMGGDEQESHGLDQDQDQEEKGGEEEEEDGDGDGDGDGDEEDSRRSRFKTERSVDTSKISLTSGKKDRIIPESLDEIIKENKLDLKVEQRQSKGGRGRGGQGKGGQGRGGQGRGGQGRGGRGMAPGRPGNQGTPRTMNPKDFFNRSQGPMPPHGFHGQQRGAIPSLMGIPTGGPSGMYGSYQQNHSSYQQNPMQMAMRSQIQAASSLIDIMSTNVRSQVNGQNHGMRSPHDHGMRSPHDHGMRSPHDHGMRGPHDHRIAGQQQLNQNSFSPMQQQNQYSHRPMNQVPQQPMGQSSGAHNYLKSLSSNLSKDNGLGSTISKDLDKSDLRNTLASGRDVRSRLGGIVTNNNQGNSDLRKSLGSGSNVLSRLGGVVGPTGKQQGKPVTGSNVLSRLGGIVNNNNKQPGGGPGNQDLRGLISRGQAGQQTGTSSLGKAITPARKAITPARKAITPVRKGITPAAKGITPAAKGITPAAKGVTPGKVIAPAGKGITPVGKGITPAGKGITPASKGITPTGKGIVPVGKGITPGKAVTPAGAQAANSLKRTHSDNSSNDQIKVARNSGGCNAITILHQISIKPIKFFEKDIGNIASPEFECNVEVNGQKYRGVGKKKQLAKHGAAEVALRAIMQNWIAGKSDGIRKDVLKGLVDKDLQQQQ